VRDALNMRDALNQLFWLTPLSWQLFLVHKVFIKCVRVDILCHGGSFLRMNLVCTWLYLKYLFSMFSAYWTAGASQLVLRPKSTAEVSAIMKYCSARQLAVVPQSGNTGLVGGSVPVFDEIVISMQLMNKVLKFDEVAGLSVSLFLFKYKSVNLITRNSRVCC
jgi:FAD binding domain